MYQELKEQWIERLESGNFRQGTGALCKNNLYCCLGVLCEIGVERGFLRKEMYDRDQPYIYHVVGKEEAIPDIGMVTTLNKEFLEYCGFDIVSHGTLINVEDEEGYIRSLGGLNDDGESFSTIAQIIRARL